MFKKTEAFLDFEKDWIQKGGAPLYAAYQDQSLP